MPDIRYASGSQTGSAGARVAALANPREVLATSTVKDLVAGSGIEFKDRGEQELKGVGALAPLLCRECLKH